MTEKDVFVLRGNHDTGDYEAFFGLHDYAVIAETFTIVVVDNAFRNFLTQACITGTGTCHGGVRKC